MTEFRLNITKSFLHNPLLSCLDINDIRIRHYSIDPYFRASSISLHALVGEDIPSSSTMYCSLLLKPEVFTTHKSRVITDFLRENQFEVIYFKTLNFTSMFQKEIWRYQVNAYPTERLEYMDWVGEFGQCIYLVLKDNLTGEAESACQRLTKLKGSTFYLGQKNRH